MVLYGKFVFISGEKKQSTDGERVFCNLNVECLTDEKVCQFGCSPEVFDTLKKYQKYEFGVDIYEFTKDGKTKVVKNVVSSKAI